MNPQVPVKVLVLVLSPKEVCIGHVSVVSADLSLLIRLLPLPEEDKDP